MKYTGSYIAYFIVIKKISPSDDFICGTTPLALQNSIGMRGLVILHLKGLVSLFALVYKKRDDDICLWTWVWWNAFVKKKNFTDHFRKYCNGLVQHKEIHHSNTSLSICLFEIWYFMTKGILLCQIILATPVFSIACHRGNQNVLFWIKLVCDPLTTKNKQI